MDKTQVIFTVADRSYFSLLKKDIHAMAVDAGFVGEKAGKIDIIVAELVSNLVKHANGGHLVAKRISDLDLGVGLELISIDNGPGISNLKRMMEDGQSTQKTLGQGLGAIQRLSDHCQIYTQKNWGTLHLVRMFQDKPEIFRKPSPVTINSIVLPKPGEQACGDGFSYKLTKDNLSLFLGDGLGHGPAAAEAVNTAIASFKLSRENDPVQLIRILHEATRRTRGLVGTVAVFNFSEKSWQICGVGNIATRVANHVSSKSYVSYNGIIGHNIPNSLKTHKVPYEPGQIIILCSDGINTRWDLAKYPLVNKYDLAVLTACIYKDHTRNTDDASIVAVKLSF